MTRMRTFSKQLKAWAVSDWEEREARIAKNEGTINLAAEKTSRCEICKYLQGELHYTYFRIYSKIDAHIFVICPEHAREARLIW